jgi:arginine/ornithine N-succinyltransferase beta subunit
MANQRTSQHLPALTDAHQHQLQHLIATLEVQGFASSDLTFLRNLASDMPHFRSNLPPDMRHTLDEIDRSAATFHNAVRGLSQAIAAFPQSDTGDVTTCAYTLDVAWITEFVQQSHELSQLAAEAALRGQHLIDQLKRFNER